MVLGLEKLRGFPGKKRLELTLKDTVVAEVRVGMAD